MQCILTFIDRQMRSGHLIRIHSFSVLCSCQSHFLFPCPQIIKDVINILTCMQGTLLQEAALAGCPVASAFLCNLLDQPAAPAWNSTHWHVSLGDHISPDLRGAVYAAAIAQPPGCDLQEGGCVNHQL